MSEREIIPRAKHQEPPMCTDCNNAMVRVQDDLYVRVEEDLHIIPMFECPECGVVYTGWIDNENKTTVFGGSEIRYIIPFDEIEDSD